MNVEQIDFAITFRRDASIVLSLGPKLKVLADRLGGQLASINAPELSPPEVPRLVLRLPNGILQIAFSRYQLAIKPPDHIAGSYIESMTFAHSLATKIFVELSKSISKTFEWSGVVVSLNFPRDLKTFPTGILAVAPIATRLTSLPFIDNDLATFELKIGRQAGRYFRNYQVTGYDLKELKLSGMGRGPISVEPATFDGAKTAETGVNVSIDVNSRPHPVKALPLRDLQNVIDEHRRATESLHHDLNLEGVL